MKRDIVGELIFWGALVFGLALYCLTSPAGLPWNGSTELALAWSGQVVELPDMPHPVWGYFVWLFGGHYVALSAVALAIAGGFIGAMTNRHFGWRFGVASALVWIMLPPVWDRAITGVRSAFVASGIVLAVWFVHASVLFFTRRARATQQAAALTAEGSAQTGYHLAAWRMWVNRIAARVVLGAAVLFAIVSASFHDYKLGEAASAYARVMLDEAGERMVILNGVADDQMVWEEARRRKGAESRLLLFRNDLAYRAELVARVKKAWPAETNLWVAAQIGPAALADVAFRHHPDRVYMMTGKTTTLAQWEKRWAAMADYLDSSDRFISLLRRAFAFEGNTLANQLQADGKLKEAWGLYWRLYTEIDPGNASSLVNLSEMLRRGYTANVEARQRIERGMKGLLREGMTAQQMWAQAHMIVAAYGPVMPDSKALAEMRARIEKRLAELEKQGAQPDLSPEWRSLIEWNNSMVHAHDMGDIDKAARIARTILSKPEWRSFIPANAIMGSVMAVEGDYVAAEMFYRVALQGQGKAAPTPVIFNDYADVLRHLGRFDEAEQYARRAVREDTTHQWLYELTLAQVLRDAKKNPDEVKSIVDGILKRTPIDVRKYVRKEFGR